MARSRKSPRKSRKVSKRSRKVSRKGSRKSKKGSKKSKCVGLDEYACSSDPSCRYTTRKNGKSYCGKRTGKGSRTRKHQGPMLPKDKVDWEVAKLHDELPALEPIPSFSISRKRSSRRRGSRHSGSRKLSSRDLHKLSKTRKVPSTSSKKYNHCEGCLYNSPSQLDHMGYGGCLSDE